MADKTTFDPYTQNITLYDANGFPTNISLTDIEWYIEWGVRSGISFGSQIGASLIMLLIVLLLTSPSKRLSPLFIFNSLALFLNAIHTTLSACYFTSNFYVLYNFFTMEYSTITARDLRNTIANSIINTCALLCVQASLLLQVHIMLRTSSSLIVKFWILFTLATIALIYLAFHFAIVVIEIQATINLVPSNDNWLARVSSVLGTIDVCAFALCFMGKLGYAIWQRRKLGVKKSWGPMQIVFIGGTQTLIIPVLFMILSYIIPAPGFNDATLTCLVIFLPLSSLWAAAASEYQEQQHSANQTAPHHNQHQQEKRNAKLIVTDSSDFTSSTASCGSVSTGMPTPKKGTFFPKGGDVEKGPEVELEPLTPRRDVFEM